MHVMWIMVIDGPRHLSFCYAALLCKTAEWIEVLFRINTSGCPMNIILRHKSQSYLHGEERGIKCSLCQIPSNDRLINYCSMSH